MTGPKLPDLAHDRICVAAGGELAVYDSQGYQRLDGVTLPASSGNPGQLWRWNADGFAFGTDANQVVFLRTHLVPTGAPTEVSLSVEIHPQTVGGGAEAVATVRNLGPGTAREVSFRLASAAGMLFGTVVSPVEGTVRVADDRQSLTGRLASLEPGGTEAFTVVRSAGCAGLSAGDAGGR